MLKRELNYEACKLEEMTLNQPRNEKNMTEPMPKTVSLVHAFKRENKFPPLLMKIRHWGTNY